MPNDSEIEISKGNFGQVMTIVSSIPSGSDSVVKKFLQQNPRIAMVIVENGMVTLQPTIHLKSVPTQFLLFGFLSEEVFNQSQGST